MGRPPGSRCACRSTAATNASIASEAICTWPMASLTGLGIAGLDGRAQRIGGEPGCVERGLEQASRHGTDLVLGGRVERFLSVGRGLVEPVKGLEGGGIVGSAGLGDLLRIQAPAAPRGPP